MACAFRQLLEKGQETQTIWSIYPLNSPLMTQFELMEIGEAWTLSCPYEVLIDIIIIHLLYTPIIG